MWSVCVHVCMCMCVCVRVCMCRWVYESLHVEGPYLTAQGIRVFGDVKCIETTSLLTLMSLCK